MEQPPEVSWADCAGPLAGAVEFGVSAVVSDGAVMKPGRRPCIALPRDANLDVHPLQHDRAVSHNQAFGTIVRISIKNSNDINHNSNTADNNLGKVMIVVMRMTVKITMRPVTMEKSSMVVLRFTKHGLAVIEDINVKCKGDMHLANTATSVQI